MKKKSLELRKEVEESLTTAEQTAITIMLLRQMGRGISVLTLIPSFLLSLVGYFVWGNDWLTFIMFGTGVLLAWSYYRFKRGKKAVRKHFAELNEREV